MSIQESVNYRRIAEAITYIRENFKQQPRLDEIAEKVNLSPFHFQRMFSEWAGVSPKKFLQYLSVDYAKSLLKGTQATLFDTAFETGLSGTGRLHDLFVNIEGMTPAEYKNGGKSLVINYSFAESPFGNIIIASTLKGICYMAFADDGKEAFHYLHEYFPGANFIKSGDDLQRNALFIFTKDWSQPANIKLHLKGTNFQLKVWEALLNIPSGNLSTYNNIAAIINQPAASRAVGGAVGANPVAFLIPCHRVIKSTGESGHYHWGSVRKTAMIGWEAARANAHQAV